MEPVLVEADSSLEELQALGRDLLRAGLDRSALVLAGVAVPDKEALQLVFGHFAVNCAGVLACGNSMAPLRVLVDHPGSRRARVRLVWTSDDPLSCSVALGGVLRCLRASGIDAQGAVMASQLRPRDGLDDDETALSPMANIGGAYLSELVAVALCGTAPMPTDPEDMT